MNTIFGIIGNLDLDSKDRFRFRFNFATADTFKI